MDATTKLRDVEEELQRLIKKTEDLRTARSMDYTATIGSKNNLVDANGVNSQYVITYVERDLKTVVMLLTKGFEMYQHNHVSEQEFIVISGSIEIVTDQVHTLRQGDIFKVPSFVLHSFKATEDSIVVSNLYAAYQF